MNTFTKTEKSYIEHEVQIRVHDEKFKLQDNKFKSLEDAICRLDDKIDSGLKHLDNKLTWGVGIFIATSIIGYMIPIALHFMKLS